MRFLKKIKNVFVPHYLIVGYYTKTAIGCTCGKAGMINVLNEEPNATFHRVIRRNCPICKKFHW